MLIARMYGKRVHKETSTVRLNVFLIGHNIDICAYKVYKYVCVKSTLRIDRCILNNNKHAHTDKI